MNKEKVKGYSYTEKNCLICEKPFLAKFKRHITCSLQCKNKLVLYRQKENRIKKIMSKKEEVISYVDKCIKDRFIVDLMGLNELITQYYNIGGKFQKIDTWETDEQLQYMWDYVYKFYLKNNKGEKIKTNNENN